MQLGVSAETQIFLLACTTGLGLGAVYDCLRAFRRSARHGKAAIFIEDFLYALFFGAVYFIFAAAHTGQLRFFIFVGMILGALMERIALGNFVVAAAGKISQAVWKYFGCHIAEFIAKIALFIKSVFVKNSPKFQKRKKIRKKVLKV